MAHHRNHHHHQCCCCCCCCSSSSHPLPPPPPPPLSTATTDSALLTIAAYLASSLHTQLPTAAPPPPSYTNDIPSIQPLLRRLSALETTLHHLSLPPSSSPPTHVKTQTHPQPRAVPARARAHSLRNHAARTIQTHFRTFLVRRSKTLRHLKLIAFAQTFLNNLRARLADRTQLLLLYQNPEARRDLTEKIADLLAVIDAIRSGDSMIREARRSVSRDLVGVLDVFEGPSCRNGGTKKCVAGESNGGRAETRDSWVREKPQKRFTVRRDGLESVERTNDDGFYPDIVGKDGTECKDCESDEGPTLEKVVEIFNIDDGGCYADEKSPEEEEFENGFPGFQFGGRNSGLAAPLPLQMEPRGVDLVKEMKKIGGVDLPESVS